MKRDGTFISSVCLSAALTLALFIPSFAQKSSGTPGKGGLPGLNQKYKAGDLPPIITEAQKAANEKKASAVSGPFKIQRTVPGIPRKNLISSPLRFAPNGVVPGHGDVLSATFGGNRRSSYSGTRGGPPQDRDATQTAADCLQPRFANADKLIWFASNATGIDPTTKRLVYDGSGLAYHIWSTDLDGANANQLTGGDKINFPDEYAGEQMYPEVNSASNILVYARRLQPGAGFFKIYVRALGTTRQPIPIGNDPKHPLDDCVHPTLDSAGQFVVFSGQVTGQSNYTLWICKADGSPLPGTTDLVRAVTAPGTASDLSPSFSPDGSRVVYCRRTPDGKERLFVVRIGDPSTATQWTNYTAVKGGDAKDQDPFWRTDGSVFLFSSTRKARYNGTLQWRRAATEVGTSFDIYQVPADSPEPNETPTSCTADPMDGTGQGATDPAEPALQAFDKNHFVYVSDRPKPNISATNHDIWLGLFRDLTPPFLETVPDVRFNGVPTKEGNPGDVVEIRAHLTDLQTGVNNVYAQFKDPDGAESDSMGLEHRLYYFLEGRMPLVPDRPWRRAFSDTGDNMDLFVEISQEAINPYNFTYTFPWVLYGGAADFRDGVKMWDDGPKSLGGHEPEGEVAGDGIYTGTWQTPGNPSDYLVDVYADDNGGKSIIYDNITGFTTQQFSAAGKPILFVADYIHGQVFVQSLDYDPTLGTIFARTTWQPVESYWTRNPATHGQSGLLFDPGTGAVTHSFYNEAWDTLGSNAPLQDCAIWRTECRNNITFDVLKQYLPVFSDEADPNNPGGTIKRLVAERAVVWACPYTAADIVIAQGSIDDQGIQAAIEQYLTAGGRMVLSGQDVAWSLTHHGQVINDMLTNYFKVKYVDDAPPDVMASNYGTTRHSPLVSKADVAIGGPFDPHFRRPNNTTDGVADGYFLADPDRLLIPASFHEPPTDTHPLVAGVWLDAAWNQLWIDSVIQNGTVSGHTLWTPHIFDDGTIGSVAAYNSATGAKTYYMSFGLEGLQEETKTITVLGVVYGWSDSRRFEALHAPLCWMRTTRAYGTVYSLDPNTQRKQPEPGVLVTYTSANPKMPEDNGKILGAALTGSDGSYVINGLPPSSYYVLAVKPGFRIQHSEFLGPSHGGFVRRQEASDPNNEYITRNVIDLIIENELPGAITGRVVDEQENPVANANITATATFPGIPPVKGTTDATGSFTITCVAGDWVVTCDATSMGFAAGSRPTSVTATVRSQAVTKISTGNQPSDLDDAFIVFKQAGNMAGTVTDASTGLPIVGAQVLSSITRLGVTDKYGPMTTDQKGQYDFTGTPLPAGTHTVSTSAPGYRTDTSNVVVNSNLTTTFNVALSPVTPRVARGYVSVKVAGGAEKAAPAGIPVILKRSGVLAATVNTFSPPVTDSGNTYNYEFGASIKLGDRAVPYDVSVDLSNTLYQQVGTIQSQLINDGDTTPPALGQPYYIPKITLRSPASWSVFPQLISLPFDYPVLGNPQFDPKTLMAGGNGFKLSVWDPTRLMFVNYPEVPANELLLGKGYFLRNQVNGVDSPVAVQTPGYPPGILVEVPLTAGWNLIGDPYSTELDMQSCDVRGPDGSTLLSFNDASSPTYNWVSSVIWDWNYGYATPITTPAQPYTGYWFLAFVNCTLIFHQPSFGPVAPRMNDPLNPHDGWRLSLDASTSAGVRDASAAIGVVASASDGFDIRYDYPRPPIATDRYMSIDFIHDDWGNHSGIYATDVRGLAGGHKVWSFMVNTTERNSTVTLRWPSMNRLPRNANLVLIDLTTGTRQFMRSTSAYTFNSGDTGSRPFQIETLSMNQMLRVSNLMAQATRGAGVSFNFTLSTDASVLVNVLGPTGKAVRQVRNMGPVKVGAQTVTWDGRDQGGVNVPPGMYTVEVRATTEDGQIARAVTPLVLKR